MREVKFRGLQKENLEWIYGYPIMFPDGSMAIWKDYTNYYIEPETLSEYIGLKDCEGTDIYENGILHFGEQDFYTEVLFYEGAFRILPEDEDESIVLTNKILDANYDVKVVGNTFQNPNLIQ